MGDKNEIHLGEGASAKQVAAGHHNTQTIIEQQHNYFGAPPPGAPFSSISPPRNFTGRAQEIETLIGQLTQEGGTRLAGIVGMSGVGKSALAQVVAQRTVAQFPDGQIWLELREKDGTPIGPTEAMRKVILALAPEVNLSNTADGQIASKYREILHGKRVLLVLDNAANNAQLRPLLQAEATFLVTSQRMVTEGGLDPLRLDVLTAEDARAYLQKRVARLTGQEADALAQSVGYLPLALRFAGANLAARLNVSPENYLAQLRERRLDLLRERNDPESNVEAAFGITYNQLPGALQVLWRLLGVFPAPFWTRSAQFVWGVDEEADAEGALGELLSASLIEYDAESKRYHLHDLLGEFARRRLTQDERATAEKQHAEFYLGVARDVDGLFLKGGESMLDGKWLFEQELTHLRAGQKWSAEHLETDADAARICSDDPFLAAHMMNWRMSASERMLWLGDALRAARKLEDRKAEADALGNLGNAQLELGNLTPASDFYEQALVIDREISDGVGEANSLGNLGIISFRLGDPDKALDYHNRDIAMRRELRDRRGEGKALCNLGEVYAAQGDFRKAVESCNGALKIANEIKDLHGAYAAYGNLGVVFLTLKQYSKAIDLYTKQLEIAREMEDPHGEASSLMNLGLVYKYLNDAPRALELWAQALEIYVAIDSPRAETVKEWMQGLETGDERQESESVEG